MKIDANELREEINKLQLIKMNILEDTYIDTYSEMEFVSKDEINKIIDKLEEKTHSESEFYQMLNNL